MPSRLAPQRKLPGLELPRWTSGDADNIMGTDPQGAAFALVGGK
jgi:hypothetical protein